MKHFNFDYFDQIFKEAGFITRCALRIKRAHGKNGNVLIIVPCLVGEFVATIPALSDYIHRHAHNNVDLVVAPSVSLLAKRMIGVNNVYEADSVSGKAVANTGAQIQGHYEEVIVLRGSKSVLTRIVPHITASRVSTKLRDLARYSLSELLLKNILRRTPMRWKDFNFFLLGGTPKEIPFDQLFSFTHEDREHLDALSLPSSSHVNIVVHVRASWPMMRWPNENWKTLLQHIDTLGKFNFIFVGKGLQEKEDVQAVIEGLDISTHVAVDMLNIVDLVLLCTKCELFLGVDSGPANIAHLAKLRSIVMYGPGPHSYMSDLEGDIIIDKSNGRGLYQRFFLQKKGFINRIGVEEVLESFRGLGLRTIHDYTSVL